VPYTPAVAASASTAEKSVILVREAAQLFRRNGFQGTSMGDLGAAMNLNKGTIYHYFPSKGDILYAIYDQVLVTLAENVSRIDPRLRADEKLVQYIRAIMRSRAQLPDFVAVYFQERPWLDRCLSAEHRALVREKERAWTTGLQTIFDDGMREGLFRRINTEVVAIQLISMISSLYLWHLGEDEASANLVTDTLIGYLFEGIQKPGAPQLG